MTTGGQQKRNFAAVPSSSVPALEKGLDILEALAASPVPLSLAELAKKLERGNAETIRMLACLERRAYVRHDPVADQYAPTLRLFELAHAHPPMKTLLDAAREPMRKLTARLGESCHLSVLAHDELLIVAGEDSPASIRLSIQVGGRFDPHRAASGRLLLSTEGEFMEACDDSLDSVNVVVMRIGSPQRSVHAALAVSWLRNRKSAKTPELVLDALRDAVNAIHESLGIETL